MDGIAAAERRQNLIEKYRLCGCVKMCIVYLDQFDWDSYFEGRAFLFLE